VVDAVVDGDDELTIDRLAKIEEAGPAPLTFISNPRNEKYMATTAAYAVLVPKDFPAANKTFAALRRSLFRVHDLDAKALRRRTGHARRRASHRCDRSRRGGRGGR
jgi:UDP-3-O-[3-hydroxymyristoyl] glucosamine N-acyltransferase